MLRAKDPTRKQELKEKYKTYKNRLTKLTRDSKANHFNNFFYQNKSNLLKVWDGIKSIINTKPIKIKQDIATIKVDKQVISDKEKIAETINEFFVDIPQKIESRIQPSKKHYKQYLGEPPADVFSLTAVTPHEVEVKIKSLKNNKASGPNSIPTKILKECKKEFSVPLALLINISIETGIHPECIKLTNVIPGYKGGDKDNCNNYRPIALLSNISKITEKLIHDRLYFYLERNNILYYHQYGFRKGHSTTHALIATTEEIRGTCDIGEYACVVYLDLKKAFDTVNQDILLNKMKHYGIKGTSNNWFRSFLTGRKQYTTVGNANSTLKNIMYGVRQGSVLGPLLFILYIHDLHKVTQHCSVFH